MDGSQLITAIVNVVRLVREIFQENTAERDKLPQQELPNSFDNSSYQKDLGKRLKFIREEILHLNPRQMATFYGFEKVSSLELCEKGDDELPLSAVERLCEFFFIERLFLEEGKTPIFQSFDITTGKEDCQKFLRLGFIPYVLCNPEERYDLFCYIVFFKKDEYNRVIVSDTVGNFLSSGGGRTNIMNLIEAMLSGGMTSWDAHVLEVDKQVWQKLKDKSFYGKYRIYGSVDIECQDIFERWFNNRKEKYQMWQKEII